MDVIREMIQEKIKEEQQEQEAFILGAILLSKESADQRSVGKVCIILGLVSTLLCVVTPFFALILPMLR